MVSFLLSRRSDNSFVGPFLRHRVLINMAGGKCQQAEGGGTNLSSRRVFSKHNLHGPSMDGVPFHGKHSHISIALISRPILYVLVSVSEAEIQQIKKHI